MKDRIKIIKTNLLHWLGESKFPLISHGKFITILNHVLTVNFIKYLIIGFSTFGLDFGIFYLLDRFSPIKSIAANIVSTLSSLFFNYYMSNSWTFNAGSHNGTKLKRYTVLAIINYIFNNATFWIVSAHFGVNGLLTKVFITAAIVSWNFFLYKLWVFKTDN